MAGVFLKLTLKNKVMASKKAKIKVLNPLARKYKLSYNVGETVSIDAKQAGVIVENKDAEFVK